MKPNHTIAHQAVTFMPNGTTYAGEHLDSNSYPAGNLIGKTLKDSNGLIAKTKITSKLEVLAAKIKSLSESGNNSLSAATILADAGNIAHLEMIRLNPELQGTPEDYFWLDSAFKSVDVPMLKGRETFYDTVATPE